MSKHLDWLDRRGLLEHGNVCDDFHAMFPGWHPKQVSTVVTHDIKKIATFQNLSFEIYYASFNRMYYIFAVNKYRFRWLFLKTNYMNSNTVKEVRRIFYANTHQKQFFKELREKRLAAKAKSNRQAVEELGYIGNQYQRVFRGLSRSLGITDGSIRQPWGRPSKERAYVPAS